MGALGCNVKGLGEERRSGDDRVCVSTNLSTLGNTVLSISLRSCTWTGLAAFIAATTSARDVIVASRVVTFASRVLGGSR